MYDLSRYHRHEAASECRHDPAGLALPDPPHRPVFLVLLRPGPGLGRDPSRPRGPLRLHHGSVHVREWGDGAARHGRLRHLWPAQRRRATTSILLPSHYMADHHGYEWLIGPGLALDTARYFLVATELFGNGHSSSPSNTPEPFHGPRFPVATIRDNVEAVHRLLVEQLGVTHLRAVVGFSMGAEQAFQWAVSYPGFSDRIVATSGTAKCWPHGVVRLEAQIAAIALDPGFNGGDYTPAQAGGGALRPGLGRLVVLTGMVAAGALAADRTPRIHLRLLRDGSEEELHSRRRRQRPDPSGPYLGAARCRYDPGIRRERRKGARLDPEPVLYMPSETDLYFPLTDARYEAKFIPRVTLTPIPSLWGHPAGAGIDSADATFLNQHIAAFLEASAP